MNPNKALWEKGDFTRVAETMRESGARLVESFGIKKGYKVLDLGCGDGTTAVPQAQLGADVIECPTIRIEEPEDITPLQKAIEELPNYDWLILTSVNGVEAFWVRAKIVRGGYGETGTWELVELQ